MTVKELAEKSGKSPATIYNYAKKLGRLPTLREAIDGVYTGKRGRPVKYKSPE